MKVLVEKGVTKPQAVIAVATVTINLNISNTIALVTKPQAVIAVATIKMVSVGMAILEKLQNRKR